MIPYVNDNDPHKAKTICAYKPNLANRIIVFAVIPLSSKARTARSLSAYTLSMMILKAERERERERERGRGTMEKDPRKILKSSLVGFVFKIFLVEKKKQKKKNLISSLLRFLSIRKGKKRYQISTQKNFIRRTTRTKA